MAEFNTILSARLWRKKNPHKLRLYRQRYKLRHPEAAKEQYQKYKTKYGSAYLRARWKKSHALCKRRLKEQVFDLLGGKCCQCGFSDLRALQVDHVNGDGCIETKKVGSRSYYTYLLQIGIASGRYQLLCANCNWIKRVENKEDRRKVNG